MTTGNLSLALSYAKRGWHVFPIRENTKNRPRCKWGSECTTNEEQITKWWTSFPNDNIGIATGPSGLTVLDVDKKADKDGQATLDELELDHGELPHTLTAQTPSGGIHYYFKGSARTTVEQLGEGLDTRGAGGAGGYVLAPGSSIDGKAYEWKESSQIPVATLPEWVVHLAGRREDREHQHEAVVELDKPIYIAWAKNHLTNDAKVAIEGQKGDQTTYNLFSLLRERGLSKDKALELMLEHWNPRCIPPWTDEELEEKANNAYNYSSVSAPGGDTPEHDFGDPDIEDDEGKYGPPPVQGEQEIRYEGILDDWVWIVQAKMFYRRSDGLMIDRQAFDSRYNFMTERPSISTELFKGGRRSLRQFMQFDFRPEEPEFIGDGEVYNLWRPSDLEPKEGDPAIFLEHMAYLFTDEAERDMVLNFLAWVVQNPKDKPNFALVVKGMEGTGKSFIGQIMERIVGGDNCTRPLNASIQSQFNGWARNAKLVIIEELMARGRVDIMNHLKPMITDPIIEINEKFQPVQKITNKCAIIAFTNHEDALPIDDNDRRYAIAISNVFPKSPAYYTRLFDWANKEGGDAIIFDYLQKRDIGKFDGKGRAPSTASKDSMREAARTGYDSEWLHLYESCLPPFHGSYVCERDLVDALPDNMRGMPSMKSHARKFLTNTIPATKQHGQVRTFQGRVVLWSLLEPRDRDAFPRRSPEAAKAIADREAKRTPAMASRIYNREMSLESQQAAQEAVLGSEWDDADDINGALAEVVSLPDRARGRTDIQNRGSVSEAAEGDADESIDELLKRDADPLE